MNIYRLKNQDNAYGTYVLYNPERIPQKCIPQITEDEVVFQTELPRAIFLSKMMIPGFGGAYLFADNQGRGYGPEAGILDFNYEAAKSRLFSLHKFSQQIYEEIGFIPKNAAKGLDEARKELDGNPGQALAVLKRLLWIGEEMVEFLSRNRIARRGKRENFLLGCSTKGFTGSSEKWRKLFEELFNCVCIPTHWGVLEPRRGEKHYEVLGEMAKWCKERHMNIRGHALVWFCSLWEKQNWMGELTYDEIRQLVLERVENLMRDYGDYFDSIDFNEPMQSDGLNMTFDEHFSIMREAYGIVKKYHPECKVMINFFNEWQEFYGIDRDGMLSGFYEMTGLKASENEWSVTVYEYIDRCIEEGMKIDCLGLQWHDHPYDLFGAYELIRQWYGRYKIPIQITELETASQTGRTMFSIGRRPNPAPELYWHEPWSESIQADWFEKFLLLAYSMEEVEAFCVFGFCDAPRQWGDYVEGKGIAEWFKVSACSYTGLLDEQERPKQSYDRLKRLAKELGIQRGGKTYETD